MGVDGQLSDNWLLGNIGILERAACVSLVTGNCESAWQHKHDDCEQEEFKKMINEVKQRIGSVCAAYGAVRLTIETVDFEDEVHQALSMEWEAIENVCVPRPPSICSKIRSRDLKTPFLTRRRSLWRR